MCWSTASINKAATDFTKINKRVSAAFLPEYKQQTSSVIGHMNSILVVKKELEGSTILQFTDYHST